MDKSNNIISQYQKVTALFMCFFFLFFRDCTFKRCAMYISVIIYIAFYYNVINLTIISLSDVMLIVK